MRTILTLATLLLAGCSLNPKLEKPALSIPHTYMESEGSHLPNAGELGWRSIFRDPALQQVIETGLKNNKDLRIAILNVETARAQYGIQSAPRLPSFNLNGSYSRQKMSSAGSANIGEGQKGSPSAIQDQNSFGLGLSAFEIDLFGRVKSLSQAAYARYLASEEGQRAAKISLIASIANAWYNRELATEQLTLANKTLDDWQNSLKLARLLKQAGQQSQIDIAQAEGQVATAQADVQSSERAHMQAANALRLLVGSALPVTASGVISMDNSPVLLELPAGLPSELLTRRPDILQAERNLEAANAEIGAARAAFFPRLSLTASMGFASPALRSLFNTDNKTWQFSPQITQPIFQGGQLKAELDVAKIKKSTAVAEYEKAIETAFKEVSDGLAGNATYRQQFEAQQRVVNSAQQRQNLSYLRYKAGLENRLELLDSQRQLYSSQQSLLTLRQNQIKNAVELYKSLGGGLKDD